MWRCWKNNENKNGHERRGEGGSQRTAHARGCKGVARFDSIPTRRNFRYKSAALRSEALGFPPYPFRRMRVSLYYIIYKSMYIPLEAYALRLTPVGVIFYRYIIPDLTAVVYFIFCSVWNIYGIIL